MPEEHQQPVAQSELAHVLSLAVAPFGAPFAGGLLKKLHGEAAFEATPEATARLLGHAGFEHTFLRIEEMGECRFPVLAWQHGTGPALRLPDGQWRSTRGEPCVAPELGNDATLLAVTAARAADEQSGLAEIKDIIKAFKPQLALVAWLGILIHVAGLAIPLFSMAVYDRVLPVGGTRTLWLLTLGITLVLTLDVVLRMLRSYGLTTILSRASLQQDAPLLAILLRQRGTGTRWAEQMEMMRLTHEVREQVILHIIPTLADIPFVMMFLIAIGYVAPALLPVPLVLLVVTLVIQASLLPRLRSMARNLTHATHKRTALLLETLRSAPATRLANRQHEAIGRWNIHASQVAFAEAQGHFWNGFGQHVTITMAQLSFVLTLVAGAGLVMNGSLTVGALVATSLLCSRTISPALHLIDTLTRLQNVRANLRLVRKGMSWPIEALTVTEETPETLAVCRGEVTLANVGLKHRSDEARGVLQGINLRAAAGERWAVVGGIGAGKSTLLAMIAAMVEPTEGEVKLDGVTYSRMPVTEIRRHVALVSQTPVFADLSVREIIAGMEKVDVARMQEVLKVSGFDTVLAQQGGGLEFRPGANAERLSGGQRQMLALAVALYAEPKVLLMDEPTSQFDPDAERAFCARIKAWLEPRKVTLVVVTHREILLDLVNHMVVLVQGRMAVGGGKAQVLAHLKTPVARKESGHGTRAA